MLSVSHPARAESPSCYSQRSARFLLAPLPPPPFLSFAINWITRLRFRLALPHCLLLSFFFLSFLFFACSRAQRRDGLVFLGLSLFSVCRVARFTAPCTRVFCSSAGVSSSLVGCYRYRERFFFRFFFLMPGLRGNARRPVEFEGELRLD